jgi:asparagine synthase (glutamine-hydrolysing)
MPGFLGIVNNHNIDYDTFYEIPYKFYRPVICDEKKGQQYYFKRFVIPKFLNDKVFDENVRSFICTDGVLLNLQELKQKYHVDTNFALLDYIYSHNGITGISEIKGDFSGAILDKNTNIWYIFTNHIGSKNIFYYFDEEHKELIFSSELKMIVSIMREKGYPLNLSEFGAYCLLTFGFMIGNNTLIQNIKKIPPGSILTFSDGKIEINQYYKLSSTPAVTDSEEVIIKKLNSLFLEAIKLEYDKDLEYNYSHISTLSGGLDSRMNVINAKKLGYTDILCFCFSQSDFLDEITAKKIASDFGFKFIFHSLDNGNYLKNIDEAVFVTEGLSFYAGASHLQFTLKLFDWETLGLIHTGQVGGAVLGGYSSKKNPSPVTINDITHIASSTKLLNEKFIEKLNLLNKYENSEIFKFYERGINGTFNGYRVAEQFTEFSSPFLDKDFLDYAMRIPLKRYKEEIYHTWIKSEIPEVAKYPRENTGMKIHLGPSRLVLRFFADILRYSKMKYQGENFKYSMNPTEYWYRTNPGLKSHIEKYYDDHIPLLNPFPTLMNDANILFKNGTVLEKTQVLTLLSAIKLYNLNQ